VNIAFRFSSQTGKNTIVVCGTCVNIAVGACIDVLLVVVYVNVYVVPYFQCLSNRPNRLVN